jgi:uncharacterized membrane protein
MIADFVMNWLFFAIASLIATTAMMLLSWEAFGGLHWSLIMVVRLLGGALIIAPFVFYTLKKGASGVTMQVFTGTNIVLWILIGISAGISWATFYLAFDYGKPAGASLALITAINYASAVPILLVSWMLGRQEIDLRNVVGIVLVVVGLYLVSLKVEPIDPSKPPANPSSVI